MNKYLGGEEQLKLIINYMEAVFFAKDINKLIEETLNFLAHNFKISNASIKIFEVSCKTGKGIAEWAEWLTEKVKS